MSKNNLGINPYSAAMNLQDFCAKAEIKKPSSFLVQDLLPVPYSQVSPSSSSTSSSSTCESSPNKSTSPQMYESDSSQELGSPDSRLQCPSTLPKKNRSSFTTDQVRELERVFEKHQYVGTRERQQLALALRMTDQQVKTWFQNRRMKRKRKRAEETQYYTKLAFANRMASGGPSQPFVSSYQPSIYPGYTAYPSVMSPSYQNLSPEQQSFLRPANTPLYPGIGLSHPSSPTTEYPGISPGLRLPQPSLCQECPAGSDCNRACAPHYSYPPNMPMYTSPDYQRSINY